MDSRTHSPARGAVLVYALMLIASTVQTAAVPLLPSYGELYGVGATQAGALLAAPGLTMLVVAAPCGLAGDRVGARRLLLLGAALVAASTLGQALAGSFGELLAWRTVLGAGLALAWTAGPAWLAQTARGGGEARVGATTTSSAIGVVLGPVLAGVLAERVGLAAPFWAAGAAAALLGAALWATTPRETAERTGPAAQASLRALVRAASAQPAVRAGAAGLVLVGAVSGMVQLFVPLALHAEGVSTAAIGVAFSASAGVYAASSTGVLMVGARAVTLPVLALAALGCAVALSPAALSASSAAVVVALLLFAAPRAALSTIAYPLATRESSRAGLGESGVLGLLNAGWAAATVVGPLVAGALSTALDTRTVFCITLAGAAVMAAWLIRSSPGRVATP